MNNTKSEAIWINNSRNRASSMAETSSSFGRPSMFGVQRSISFASDGSSAHGTPIGSYSDPFESSRRMRTSSFNGDSDNDPWASSLSTSAPSSNAKQWMRSNSMSQGRGRNLSRIEEHSRVMGGFGDTIQKSMDKLFQTPTKAISQERKSTKDKVVSMICEGALRWEPQTKTFQSQLFRAPTIHNSSLIDILPGFSNFTMKIFKKHKKSDLNHFRNEIFGNNFLYLHKGKFVEFFEFLLPKQKHPRLLHAQILWRHSVWLCCLLLLIFFSLLPWIRLFEICFCNFAWQCLNCVSSNKKQCYYFVCLPPLSLCRALFVVFSKLFFLFLHFVFVSFFYTAIVSHQCLPFFSFHLLLLYLSSYWKH